AGVAGFAERLRRAGIFAGGDEAVVVARHEARERAGTRVARRPVLSRGHRLAQIALELEKAVFARRGERVEQAAHAPRAAVPAREEGHQRLEPVLARLGARRSVEVPERAEETDPGLLQALQPLLRHGLGPERLIADQK